MSSKRVVHLGWAAVFSLIASAALATPISATLAGYDLVKVGNPGNAAQSGATGTGSENQNGYGSVATDFWIGKYHVTIGQYAEFLNAVAKSDPYGLWNELMSSDQRNRGIARSGADGAYVYTVVGPNGTNPVGAQSAANRPISYVSWFDSARFANWMSNGKPTGPAGPTTTDNGAYNVGTATSGNAVARNATNPNTGAAPTFSIPTENEWYKAAYYSPVKDGPGTPGYYLYGTQSDSTPGNGGTSAATALADKDLPNQANYRADNRYAVTGLTTVPITTTVQNFLTEVGAFTNSYSYYGAFDMTGNVSNWTDLDGLSASGALRGRRGGNWGEVTNVSSSFSAPIQPSNEGAYLGFRLVSPVPEPATLGITAGGLLLAGGHWVLKRRRPART